MSGIAAGLCLFSTTICNIVNQTSVSSVVNPFNIRVEEFPVFPQFLFGSYQRTSQRSKTPHQSPCPQKFNYFYNGREWKARILVDNINPNIDTQIEADFVLPYQAQTNNYNGRIDLVVQGKSIKEDLGNGLPVLFEVAFGSQKPVPKLVAIYKNGEEFCVGPAESPNRTTKLRFKYELNSINEPPQNYANNQQQAYQPPQQAANYEAQPNYNQNQNYYQTPAPYQPPAVPYFQSQDTNSLCGIPVAGFTQSLIINGEPTKHGEWPWLVAFYRSNKGNLEFICGASLISNWYSLTAAHCIQEKMARHALKTVDALLFIGKYNLVKWNEEGFVKKGVKSFKVHHDWRPEDFKYDADIALIEMDSPVTYTNYIIPICLWNGPNDLDSVVGQFGAVVGWGQDEYGEKTDTPKKIEIPIVSESQCLRSNSHFVSTTSDRTFCAGDRSRNSPCRGDSGGGLALKSGGRWFLRGVISFSLFDGNICDVNNYAVFTDVAKFMPWVRHKMLS